MVYPLFIGPHQLIDNHWQKIPKSNSYLQTQKLAMRWPSETLIADTNGPILAYIIITCFIYYSLYWFTISSWLLLLFEVWIFSNTSLLIQHKIYQVCGLFIQCLEISVNACPFFCTCQCECLDMVKTKNCSLTAVKG